MQLAEIRIDPLEKKDDPLNYPEKAQASMRILKNWESPCCSLPNP